MKRLRFSALLLGAIISAAVSLNAATSGAVGAVTITVPAGPTIISIPFLKPVVYQAPVSSISSADVTMPGTVPTLTGPHYLHVLSGADQGRIFPIDSVSGAVVTLENVPANLAAADTVAIRAFMTVADLGTVPLGTTLTFLDAGGVPFVGGFGFSGWTIPTDTVIQPGEAIVINNNNPFSLTLYGSVSHDDVIFETFGGPAIVGNLDPVNGSADLIASIKANAPLGWTLTTLAPGTGAPTVYLRTFAGWSIDPATIDTTSLKSIVINTGVNGSEVLNQGIPIVP